MTTITELIDTFDNDDSIDSIQATPTNVTEEKREMATNIQETNIQRTRKIEKIVGQKIAAIKIGKALDDEFDVRDNAVVVVLDDGTELFAPKQLDRRGPA